MIDTGMRRMITTRNSPNLLPVCISLGIVVAHGKAYKSFIDMVYDVDISLATTALSRVPAHDKHYLSSQNLQIELYSDMLYALALSSGSLSFTKYLNRVGKANDKVMDEEDLILSYSESPNVLDRVLLKIWQSLRGYSLHVISVFDGIFIHLGTTLEFLELITFDSNGQDLKTANSHHQSSVVTTQKQRNLQILQNKYPFRRMIASEIFPIGSPTRLSNVLSQSVIIGSIIIGPSNSLPETENPPHSPCSFVEYSILSGSINLGNRSIVSHVSEAFGKDLRVLDDMVVQQIPLQSSYNNSTTDNPIVHIVYNINDDIKANYKKSNATFCGVSWMKFLEVSSSI